MKGLTLQDLAFSNQKFWTGFLATSFPNAWDEASDLSLTELLEEHQLADCAWWDHFTGYYEGILEESDGYLEEPQTFLYELTPVDSLKIEFHPGDTLYFVNDRQIACTGPHSEIQIFPFADLLEYAKGKGDDLIFLLLLPLTSLTEEESPTATGWVQALLREIIPSRFVERIADCIVSGLME